MGTTVNCCAASNNVERNKSILIKSHCEEYFQEKPISELCKNTLNKYFDGYMTGVEADHLISEFLTKQGFKPKNTLYSDCVCPDEVNHDSSFEITSLLTRRYNGRFPLGGEAGLPFTGATGWGAFTSHCPKDGNIVVLIASHIGVNKTGQIGKVLRPG